MSTILDTKPATQNHDQTNWLIHARTRKQQQLDLIPPEWTILVPKGILNVTQVPYECGVLDELELTITDTVDVAVILEKLRDRIWSSVQVTKAFYKRAIIAHQTTNCLTEIFIERALARAAEMDKYLKDNGKLMGPLHGLPVSLKDQFRMKGLETINGYVANIGDFATEDAVLVDILYQLGAVPFVRTNLPQTLMWGETCNNVFGRTLNPHNLNLTSGGSSGGEGALIAMRGSPLGIGTDIGGSLRIPASMCGIYALRPSYCRLPFHGIRNTLDGQESIMCVIGPMANSLSGLKMFTKAVIDTRPWLRDPLCIRKVWDEDAYQLVDHGGRGGRKCFAMLYDNGLVKPHPPVFRAMETMKKALEAAGHQVIEWQNHKHEEIFINVVTKLYFSDGGEEFRRECERSGEPRIMTMDPTLYSAENYNAETNKGKPIFDPLSVYELWQVHKQKRELRKEYLDLWQSTISRTNTGRPVDAIISPAAPFASAPHGKNTFTFYTSLWNCLDYVTGALPVTVVDLELDEPSPPHTFYNANDEAIYNSYDPEIYKYAPVGLQVTGRTLEEEGVLAMMEEIDEALNKYKMDSSS